MGLEKTRISQGHHKGFTPKNISDGVSP